MERTVSFSWVQSYECFFVYANKLTFTAYFLLTSASNLPFLFVAITCAFDGVREGRLINWVGYYTCAVHASAVFRFLVLLVQSYCKIFEPPNVFAIIFAELVKIDKIYRPGRKTKSRGAEKLVFHLEKLSFLNCNCNCHHHGHRGICVSHIWAQAMTITITVQNSAPYFLRKRRKRNLLYIYI